mgnify:CR=1 FL=1
MISYAKCPNNYKNLCCDNKNVPNSWNISILLLYLPYHLEY